MRVGKTIFVDIETLPPDERLRDRIPEALRRKLARRRRLDDEQGCGEERFRRLALHAEFGRLLCVGVIVEGGGEVTCRGVLGRDRRTTEFHLDEARTLRGFWKLMEGFDPARDLVVGHNVLEFDLPFLYKRSIIHRVRPAVSLSFARYRRRPVFDTMKEWSCWSFGCQLSLSELAGVLGVGFSKAEGMDGGRVYEYYRAGRHVEIADYCLRDVELARAVYHRMVSPEAPEAEIIAAP